MNIKFLSKPELEKRLEDFCELSRSCFSAEVNENIIKQRYIDNPYEDLLMCVAEDKGKIIANYSAVPSIVEIDGFLYKAAQSLNTMTHPDYSGRGLFVTLANQLYKYMLQKKYALIYGFPNNLSNGIFCSKLGWRDVYEVPTMELKISQNRKMSEIDTNRLHSITWGDLNYQPTHLIEVFKESKYLHWRYKDHCVNKYNLLKISSNTWCIYHIYNKEINLTEFHYADDVTNLITILDSIYCIGKQENVEKITLWSPINTKEHTLIEKYGFINTSPVRYFGIKKLDYNGLIDLYDARNWRVFMGDDNVY